MSGWLLWTLLVTCSISLIAHGVVLFLLWNIWRSQTMVERSFGVVEDAEPTLLPKAGTTFLLDDAEVARREAQLRKESRQRVGLMPERTPEGGFRTG